jgi:hypothetical protein
MLGWVIGLEHESAAACLYTVCYADLLHLFQTHISAIKNKWAIKSYSIRLDLRISYS